jgi:hypothetical protein
MTSENKDQLELPLKAPWLPFDETTTNKKPDENKFDDVFKDFKSENKEPIKDDENKDKSSLAEQLEKLTKQHQDTKIWGNKQRAAYVTAKKKIEELTQKMLDDGTLLEEDIDTIKEAFNHSFETNDLKDVDAKNDPYKPVIDKLVTTLEEYKNWNVEDKNADTKFSAFFKHLELVTPKKLEDIRTYLANEDPKVALKYILEEGGKYYNKFYKQVLEKGDAFSYIEELTNKNEKLEKKLKELQQELDQTEGKVYSKSIKERGSYNPDKPFKNKWIE